MYRKYTKTNYGEEGSDEDSESGADIGSASPATRIGQVLDEGAIFVQLLGFASHFSTS